MPNWCDNILTIEGPAEELARFVSKVKEHGDLLDATVPCPESLNLVVSGSMEDAYHILYGNLAKHIPPRNIPEELGINLANPSEEDREALFAWHFESSSVGMEKARAEAKKYKHNIETHGHATWYSWSIENWGTKWGVPTGDLNLPEASGERWQCKFDTAWAPPVNWVYETSEQFPNLNFKLEYYEVGMWFAGYVVYKDGECTSTLEGAPDTKTSQGDLVFPFCADSLASLEEG